MENTKSVLYEILAQYENNDQPTDETPSEMKESDYKLQEYLVGDGNTRHLYDYYDLVDQGK
jgi:hypothetical protein